MWYLPIFISSIFLKQLPCAFPHLVEALKSGSDAAQEFVLDMLCLLKHSWSTMPIYIAKSQAIIVAEAVPILQMLMKTCLPSSSVGSLSSEKSTPNPYAEDFKVNPNIKGFIPPQMPPIIFNIQTASISFWHPETIWQDSQWRNCTPKNKNKNDPLKICHHLKAWSTRIQGTIHMSSLRTPSGYWKNGLQLHFFHELQFQKPGCGYQSDSIHGVRPESSLRYLFMASGMLYVHISTEVLKLLTVQRGFILTEYLAEYEPTTRDPLPLESLVKRKMKIEILVSSLPQYAHNFVLVNWSCGREFVHSVLTTFAAAVKLFIAATSKLLLQLTWLVLHLWLLLIP